MPSPLFLALTASEFQTNPDISDKIAWMACHFSSYGTGISNPPPTLPPGSMLILNDRTPVCGHDPQQVAQQLAQIAKSHDCSRVLLDFQRPGDKDAAAIIKAVVEALPCPVGVSSVYSADLHCPVFLPPLPLHMPLEAYLLPWQGRTIWLEAALDTATYTVTQEGCRIDSAATDAPFPHLDQELHCRYRIDMEEAAIRFTLHRSWEDLQTLMESGQTVDCFIGLYQELAQKRAHSTAFSQ